MTPRSTDRLRQDAKALRKGHASGDAAAQARVAARLGVRAVLNHADALHVIALEQGFGSWPRLKLTREIAAMDHAARAERLKIALYFGHHWVTDALLSADPDLGRANFGLACAMYDTEEVARVLASDPEAATRAVGVRTPLLHLCFSRWFEKAGPEAALDVAEQLHAAGADVNESYPFQPGSLHELSALYGALGHAGNLALAEWLLQHGADPNDNESLYHSTELENAEGLRLLLAHGARPEGTNALPRALDFDNLEMVTLLLEAGADPNEGISEHPSGEAPAVIPSLHQAARRMCSADVAQALIDHGADSTELYHGHTAYAIARMRGNRAVAGVLEAAGQATDLSETEARLAGAADGRVEGQGRLDPEALSHEQRLLIHRLLGFDGSLPHVQRLVSLGLDPAWTDEQGMPAIHIAGWEGQADAVAWLLAFEPDLDHINTYGGDLIGTVIHGAEFCPARARRDHLRCARLVLDAGARLRRREIEETGVIALAEMLAEWAEAHPDRIVERAG
ncbi:MAG: ankyrin repeat domain-containing protein [Pseudomonadota bacterium]